MRAARLLAPAAALPLMLLAPPAAAQSRITDTPVDRFGPFNGEQLQISTGTDDDTLTFRAELPVGPSQGPSFSLIASTPLHGGDNALPASLDALANGSKLTLRIGFFDLPIAREDPRAAAIAREARRECNDAQPTPSSDPERPLPACLVVSNIIGQYAPEDLREYVWHTVRGGVTDFGFDASVGINEFQWIDPVTFGQRTERHTDWSVAAHLAKYFAGTTMTFSVSYQSAYEAAAEQQVCPPGSTDPADCTTARAAAPTRNEHFVLSAGLRHRFAAGDGTLMRLAIAPEVNYNVEDDVWGVDVPVYFIPGPDGGLNGGVRLSYRSDREDEFSIGVFIGTTFNLLGGG